MQAVFVTQARSMLLETPAAPQRKAVAKVGRICRLGYVLPAQHSALKRRIRLLKVECWADET